MKSFSSRLFVLMGCLVSLTVSTRIHAGDCIKNQDGNVVCGEGQCAVDQYGKVFCAKAGGGAMKDSIWRRQVRRGALRDGRFGPDKVFPKGGGRRRDRFDTAK